MRQDLTKHKPGEYGWWKVLYYVGENYWMCLCTRCNKTKRVVNSCNFKYGRSTQCLECLHEHAIEYRHNSKYLGMSQTREARIWRTIAKNYPDNRWGSFINFYESIEPIPPRSTIIPVNPSKPIGPNNYKFTTNKKGLKYQGKGIREWARELGISRWGLMVRMGYGQNNVNICRTLEEAVKMGPKNQNMGPRKVVR